MHGPFQQFHAGDSNRDRKFQKLVTIDRVYEGYYPLVV
jgi:hypothetical protein